MRSTRMEEWRDIEGFKDIYQVSSLGRIRSLARSVGGCIPREQSEIILTQCDHNNGYRVAHLRKLGTRKKAFVHRIVAQAFIENPEGKPIVNHKDRDRTNNTLVNLEWVNESENMMHYRNDDKRKKEAAAYVPDPEFDPADLPW